MGSIPESHSPPASRPATRSSSHSEFRPLPLRNKSEPEHSGFSSDALSRAGHLRTKSTHAFSGRLRLSSGSSRRSDSTDLLSPLQESFQDTAEGQSVINGLSKDFTPPMTPDKRSSSEVQQDVEMTKFDFFKIDYELDRARRIGEGLWSSVYLASPIVKTPSLPAADKMTPPTTPHRPSTSSVARLFAIKSPARPDARDIFFQEARVLTKLQRSSSAYHHVVPFHGLDTRNSSLVFEGVIGGSLEDLSSRFKQMTELERHLELRQLFPGLARDLISGLRFIHAAGIVHADIKPANILLDIVDENGLQQPVLRVRYIDFSASFVVGEDSAANAGGTWDYMAPEQLRLQKEWNIPTYASDVWSLGIVLLSVIVGDSPYTAACGDNMFRRREAIKSGDPLGFTRVDPNIQKRVAACQDFVDCFRLALQKDRDRRYTATGWETWLERHEFET